jgi:uncharacterized membrane protein YhdT
MRDEFSSTALHSACALASTPRSSTANATLETRNQFDASASEEARPVSAPPDSIKTRTAQSLADEWHPTLYCTSNYRYCTASIIHPSITIAYMYMYILYMYSSIQLQAAQRSPHWLAGACVVFMVQARCLQEAYCIVVGRLIQLRVLRPWRTIVALPRWMAMAMRLMRF